VYGEGSGFDCRKHVQHLNLLRKDTDEQALAVCDNGDSVEHDTDSLASVALDEPQNHVVSFIHKCFFNAFSIFASLLASCLIYGN